MHRKTSSVFLVGYFEQLLKELGVEYADKEVEARVVVRDDRKQCCLLFSQLPEIQFIRDGIFEVLTAAILPPLLSYRHHVLLHQMSQRSRLLLSHHVHV